ncbi:MAG: aspartyl protease family protein [Acidobacteria bacterium]|nr:aspartyl protease family protein [Acidobacteriota bacterium]
MWSPAFSRASGRAVVIALLLSAGSPAEAIFLQYKSSHRKADRAIRQGDYDRAEKFYREALERDRSDVAARLGLSTALIKKGLAHEAYLEASMIVGLDPLNARGHALLGTALLRSGNFLESLEEFKTALALDERTALALAGLAEIDFFENRSTEAYQRLERAVSIDGGEPEYWIAFGRTAARLERFGEAARHYERFLTISPRLEVEKRERYRGLIDFYHALGALGISHLHRTEGPKSARIPVELRNERPVVRVKLNGNHTASLVVDTGASISVLSKALAARMNMRPLAKGGSARAVGGGGTFPIIYGLVESMEIGELKVSSMPVYFRSILQADEGSDQRPLEPVEGFIGLSVLSNFRVTLDYQAKEMLLRRGVVGTEEFLDDPGQTSVAFRSTNGGLLSAEVLLAGNQKANFLVDSGASTTILAEQVIEKYQLKKHVLSGDRVRVLGAAGIKEDVEVVTVPVISVSGLERQNVRAPILDMQPVNESAGFLQSGILGGNFLKHFRVVFDFDQYRILFKPIMPSVDKPPSGQEG